MLWGSNTGWVLDFHHFFVKFPCRIWTPPGWWYTVGLNSLTSEQQRFVTSGLYLSREETLGRPHWPGWFWYIQLPFVCFNTTPTWMSVGPIHGSYLLTFFSSSQERWHTGLASPPTPAVYLLSFNRKTVGTFPEKWMGSTCWMNDILLHWKIWQHLRHAVYRWEGDEWANQADGESHGQRISRQFTQLLEISLLHILRIQLSKPKNKN